MDMINLFVCIACGFVHLREEVDSWFAARDLTRGINKISVMNTNDAPSLSSWTTRCGDNGSADNSKANSVEAFNMENRTS